MQLFNTNKYQATTHKCDWDGAEYDSAWDDGSAFPQNQIEVSAVVEHSTVVEVLEEDEISSDRWNPAHFGEVPRQIDANGNPTIFFDESIEPPEPDDFESLEEYEEAWHKWEENYDNSICVAELERVSPSAESSQEKSNYADSAKSTSFVKKDCAIASPTCQSTTTCENSKLKEEASTSSHHHHHVSPLPLKESAWVQPISEIVSPQYYELLTELNPNSSVSKTSPDCYRQPNTQEKNPEHILNRCSGSFGSVGTMRNGLLSERDLDLEPSGKVKDSYSLPRPGALSCSGNGRPPGNTKSEAKAKKLGILQKNEVFNPEWLEQEFGLPIGWTSPQECRAATELLERVEQPSEISSTPELQPSQSNEYSTSTPKASVNEQSGEYSNTKSNTLKAISLWQPWASLIPLGLKHYETRSWKTKYRGKLLICSTAKSTKTQHLHYLKICNDIELPEWNETNFPHGCAIAVCDLVDCIEITPEFIAQQSQTEILCGNWQVGRYAWKLENIQPIAESFAVKGKQGLFNIPSTNFESYLKKKFTSTQESKKDNKKSDHWYTPLHIVNLVVQVLGAIDLDPCADDGKHIPAVTHYTFNNDGLTKPWYGRVFINPPYSYPGAWMKKLQAEFESGKVKEAIALLPAATDTNWLSPVLKTQAVCFWKGRIKFLDEDYQPKRAARQSHVLVYWGENWQRFKGVFEEHGFVSVPNKLLGDKQDSSPSNLDSSPSKIISPSKNSPSNLLGDKENSPSNDSLHSPSKNLSPSNSPSKLLGDKEESSPSNSPSKIQFSPSKKRLSGEGNGYIYWRTITKNGKEYPQAYYHWKEGSNKRSKYIPKKLLSSVEDAEAAKRPVIEILKLLGVETSPSKLLGDEENSASNDVNADISDSTEKLLGDKWIKNGETTISQGFQGSPSNLDNSPSKIELSSSKRRKGDGSGNIHWRTITRGGKDYLQAYYHYEFWSGGDRLVKSSKYIPKRLLSQVQRLEAKKSPVKEILRLLGIIV
ncbi:MAG: DNA N-6-adenine-methyltransferase [Rivularia sp. (in: cyanobacteria)]